MIAEEKKVVEEKEKRSPNEQSDEGQSPEERSLPERGQSEGKTAEEKETEPKKEKAKLTKKMEEVMETIENMSVLELSNLVKALEERFGVSAVSTVAVPTRAAAASGGEQPAGEEKTSFTVILAKAGEKKIQVIKEIRTITPLGLKEAKDLVDAAPKPVKENLPKEEAEEIKKKLEAVGATVELK